MKNEIIYLMDYFAYNRSNRIVGSQTKAPANIILKFKLHVIYYYPIRY